MPHPYLDDFMKIYEKPQIYDFIVGFSGIDPQKKFASIIDHELLNSLFGGNSDGHFHLTREQLDWIIEQMSEKYPPEITPNQAIQGVSDELIDDYSIQGSNVRP